MLSLKIAWYSCWKPAPTTQQSWRLAVLLSKHPYDATPDGVGARYLPLPSGLETGLTYRLPV